MVARLMATRLTTTRLANTRLAKNSTSDRRRAAPVAAIHEALDQLWAADKTAVRIAPSDLAGGAEPVGNELDRLYAALEAVTPEDHPRTAKLLASSNRKVAQKVIEEAGEVALAAVKHNNRNIVRESADLLYHLAVLWRRAGIGSEDVWAEMRRRADSLGIAEKLPKSRS
ncbi:MAG: phosphoribosyl-ATP diphosphatase [Xanthobacteraceae bacterium]|jgi:phosphoribosyl-ATP pyrophosphohydrolase